MPLLLTVTTILSGVLAYQKLPVNDLPSVDFPVLSVNVSYPGASPETMAATVATPLERQFLQIPGIDIITSNSSQGYTGLTLQFNLSKSVDAAATDVQAAIQQASGALPPDLPSQPPRAPTLPVPARSGAARRVAARLATATAAPRSSSVAARRTVPAFASSNSRSTRRSARLVSRWLSRPRPRTA